MLKIIVLIIFLFFSSTVSAYYPAYVSRTDHLTELSYKSSGQWKSVIINNSSVGKPIHDEVKSTLKSVNDKLFDLVKVAARDGLNDFPGVRFRELKFAKLDGPLTTKIITDGNGVVTVEVGGFKFSSEVKFDFSLFTLYGKVKTTELKFAANYDVITGRVYNLRDIGNDIDIDGNGIINSVIAKVADIIVDIFTSTMIEDTVDEVLGQEFYIAGLDSVFIEGVWVINGVDIGAEIKNAVKGVSPNKYIDISLSEWEHRYYEGSKYRYYYRNRIEIDISDEFKFNYGNEPVFATGNWINPCAGPGGASSGCYEP